MILTTSLTPLLLLIPSTLALAVLPAPHGALIPGGSGFRECVRLFAHDPPPPPTHIQSLDAYIPMSLGEPTMMKVKNYPPTPFKFKLRPNIHPITEGSQFAFEFMKYRRDAPGEQKVHTIDVCETMKCPVAVGKEVEWTTNITVPEEVEAGVHHYLRIAFGVNKNAKNGTGYGQTYPEPVELVEMSCAMIGLVVHDEKTY